MTSSVPIISNTASIVVAGAGSRAEKEENNQNKKKLKHLNSYNMPKLLIDYILIFSPDPCVWRALIIFLHARFTHAQACHCRGWPW